jgi:hypothetical protein
MIIMVNQRLEKGINRNGSRAKEGGTKVEGEAGYGGGFEVWKI